VIKIANQTVTLPESARLVTAWTSFCAAALKRRLGGIVKRYGGRVIEEEGGGLWLLVMRRWRGSVMIVLSSLSSSLMMWPNCCGRGRAGRRRIGVEVDRGCVLDLEVVSFELASDPDDLGGMSWCAI
jgi:hypothetical protein